MTDAKLFDKVFYYLSKTILPDHRSTLGHILDLNGGKEVELTDDRLTHYVSHTLPSTLESLPEGSSAHIVTPPWVERTLKHAITLDPAFYSADPSMLFSGVVATSCSLSAPDNEVLSAGITSLGGQWRNALTKDVTHVFALGGGSSKYETAMHFKDGTGMKVLVPHWFDDVVRLGVGGLDTGEYEWPEPGIFKGEVARKGGAMKVEKRALYETALGKEGEMVESQSQKEKEKGSGTVWKDIKIVLGTSLELNDSQREAHRADIEREGGTLLDFTTPDEELERIEQGDVYVTRYRSGPAFVKAYRLKKTIGTLPWLWYVRATGTLSNPLHQLLHYPIPRKPIPGFASHIITVTNYTGKDRDYIKSLITTMGAEFTPSMSGKNTIVIAAFLSGTKTSKAAIWQIPVVNHLWLEDCFSQWRDLSPAANPKYVSFSPAVDYGTVLTEERGLGGIIGGGIGVGRGYEQAELDEMEKDLDDVAEDNSTGQDEGDGESLLPLRSSQGPRKGILKNASMQSLRSAEEVEGVVATSSFQSRRPVVGGYSQSQDENVFMGGVGDISIGGYQDIDVPLNEDGRLSLSEDEPELPQTPVRKRGRPRKGSVSGTPASSRRKMGTPSTGRRNDDEEARPKKLVRRVGRPRSSSRASSTREKENEADGDVVRHERNQEYDLDLESATKKGSVIKRYRARSRSQSRSRTVEKSKSPMKGKGRMLVIHSSSEEEDEDGGEMKTNTPSKMKTPSKPATTRRRPTIPSDSEGETSAVESRRGRGRPPKKPSRRSLSKGKDDDAGEKPTPKTPRTFGREVAVVVPTLKQVRSLSRQRSEGYRSAVEDEEEKDVEPAESPAVAPKKRGRPRKSERSVSRQRKDPPEVAASPKGKVKEKAVERESVPPSPPKKRGRPRKSVEQPELVRPAAHKPATQTTNEEGGEEEKDGDMALSQDTKVPKKRGRPRKSNERAEIVRPQLGEQEEGVVVPPPPRLSQTGGTQDSTTPKKRGRPRKSVEQPKPPKPVEHDSGLEDNEPVAGDEDEMPPTKLPPEQTHETPLVVRTYGKRNAATKATRRLHEEVMPDVVSFQRELKNGSVKVAITELPFGSGRRVSVEGEASGSAKKGGKKRSLGEGDDVAGEGEEPERKRMKSSVVKGRKSVGGDEDVAASPPMKGRKKPESKARSATAEDSGVVVMTTQVNLPDDVIKAFVKLGGKFTTKPSECTHLVARSIVRTEKFLCAMAVASRVVSVNWVEMCIAKKSILPADAYTLKDPTSEQKFGFKLSQALKRATEKKGKLFEGKTFYVTPKVQVDTKLMRNVIMLGGGYFSTQTPTLRILKSSPNRVVISSPGDIAIWRPLAEAGFPVYSQELVLTGMLKQEVDWEGVGMRVAESV